MVTDLCISSSGATTSAYSVRLVHGKDEDDGDDDCFGRGCNKKKTEK
jgi:hypothetical protein